MKYKLKDICLTVTDGSHFSPKAQDEGYPMFSVKDMLEYGFDYTNCKRISEEDFEKMKSSGCIPQKGDVLVAKDGSYLKEIFVCTETRNEAILSSIAIFRPNHEIVDSYYLCYLLKSPQLFNYISTNCVSGSALPRIVLKAFKEVEMDVPSIEEQLKVVSILKSIDEKVQNNTAINRNLSEQAKILFKDRFIDVDAIPNDWQELMLEDIASLSAGGDKPKVVSDEITDTCSVPIYSNGISDEGLYGYTEEAKIFAESVTVSARGTIGYVCLRQEPYVPIVRLVSVVPKENMMSAKYLYLWLESLHIMGTGTTQQQLTVPDFKKTKIIVPPYAVIKEFTDIVNPMYEAILKNKKENKELAKVRDSLLPKLMSGELDVSELDI